MDKDRMRRKRDRAKKSPWSRLDLGGRGGGRNSAPTPPLTSCFPCSITGRGVEFGIFDQGIILNLSGQIECWHTEKNQFQREKL